MNHRPRSRAERELKFLFRAFESGRAEFYSATDEETLEAGFRLAKLEGIIPALETAHALAVLEQVSFQQDDVVVVCLSGRGDKDLSTYIEYMRHEQN